MEASAAITEQELAGLAGRGPRVRPDGDRGAGRDVSLRHLDVLIDVLTAMARHGL